ncbi:MAG: Thymidylate kinase [Myxococcota bacterium]|nr:Thymidylate kinase [Myxococcota bacterium]
MTPGNGTFIVFEGVDGSGKTTQAALLAESLRARGLSVKSTREPTSGPWGRRIRELYTQDRETWSAETELEWFIRDREDHVRDELAPWLAAGDWVVCDRYYYSTAAYQGARGLDPAAILRRNRDFAPRPDLTIIVDIPVAAALERIRKGRGEQPNSFEKEESLTRTRAIFLSFSGPEIFHLDGTRPPDIQHQAILDELKQRGLLPA